MKSATDDPAAEAVRREAADWIVLMHGPDAAESQEAFRAWLDREPAHADAYRDLSAHWDRAKFLTHTRTGRDRDLSSVAIWYRRPAARWTAAAAIIFFLVAGLALTQLRTRPQRAPMVAYATKTGEIRTVALTDGSRVTLDAGSRMQVAMTDVVREVRLTEGSARFEVVADKVRPFAVSVAGGTVTTDQGLFDVGQTPGLIRVTPIRGRLSFKGVTVAPGLGSPAAVAIAPGQRLVVADATRPQIVAAQPSPAADWTTGMLSFDGERLGDAVVELNRHNARKIVLTDLSIGGLRITGAFHANDAPGFARAIATMFGLTRRERADGTIELGLKK